MHTGGSHCDVIIDLKVASTAALNSCVAIAIIFRQRFRWSNVSSQSWFNGGIRNWSL